MRDLEATGTAFNPIVEAEAFIGAIGAKVTHGGDRAFYSPGTDSITLPKPEHFKDAASYYRTSLHEHGHWTGSDHRLNRMFGKRFGDSAYAVELIAELSGGKGRAGPGEYRGERSDGSSTACSAKPTYLRS